MPYLGNIKATEIIGPTANGTCQPLIIKDTSGRTFVAKGMGMPGRSGLVSEIISVQLAERLGLSVPNYAVLNVPDTLIDFSLEPTVRNFCGGPAFASEWVDGADNIRFRQAQLIPNDIQQKVLFLDVWIGNCDRQLSPFGGNVNLLNTTNGNPIVFDHNLAFHTEDPDWVEDHVFAEQAESFRDIASREIWINEVDRILSDWGNIISLIPNEWSYWDSNKKTNPTRPDLAERLEWLKRIYQDPNKFWSVL